MYERGFQRKQSNPIKRRFINKGYLSEKAITPRKEVCNVNYFGVLEDKDDEIKNTAKDNNFKS